jgi:hypothetical protein
MDQRVPVRRILLPIFEGEGYLLTATDRHKMPANPEIEKFPGFLLQFDRFAALGWRPC